MTINKTINDAEGIFTVEGRLDTTTAPQLEKELKDTMVSITSLVIDFEKLDYISSAGLRVLLMAQKTMSAKSGTMVLKHVNETVKEVFEVTGFIDILTVE